MPAAGLVFALQRTQIDWVNVIQVGSTQIRRDTTGHSLRPFFGRATLGPAYSHIKFKVSGKVCDPNYRLKDGDAVLLELGTPIY